MPSQSPLEALPTIASRHGPYCACRATLTIDALPLSTELAKSVTSAMLQLGLPPTLARLYQAWPSLGDVLPPRLRLDVESALMEFRDSPCLAESLDCPPIGAASLHRHPGRRTLAERWPDDIEEFEWASWFRGEAALDYDPIAVLEAIDTPATITSLLLDDARWASDAGLGPDESWIVQPQVGQDLRLERLNLSTWDLEQRMRVLLAIRDQDLTPPVVGRLAEETGHSPEEVRQVASYLASAEIGQAPRDPVTAILLQQYPPARTRDVVRIVAMADSEVSAEVDEQGAEGLDLLERRESPVFAPTVRPAAAGDGGPDPLATVRTLLPGGRGVLGPPPIIYTPTQLDRQLLPAMRANPPTLIVLSGNAGDGKTAFIASVLRDANVQFDPTVNVYNIQVGRNPYRVVLDGSEDTVEQTNHELLESALGAFKGAVAQKPERGTLIAINKGRLLHFLDERRREYPHLWNLASSKFLGREASQPGWYQLIDLNDRSMLAPDPETSVFGGIVEKLTAWPAWETECGRCSAQASCPVRQSIVDLRRPDTRRQLWHVLAAVDLDDRVHVTARHLVTKIVDAIVGEHRCADVRARASTEDGFVPDERFTSRLFAVGSPTDIESTVMNRVTATYDPSERSSPTRDRRIVYQLLDPPVVSASPTPMLTDMAIGDQARYLAQQSVDDAPDAGARDYREKLIQLARHASRRLFMLAPSDPLAPPPALSTQDRYLERLGGDDLPSLLPQLVGQLNATLGINGVGFPGLLVPRDYARGLAGTGFAALVPIATLRLDPATHSGAVFEPQAFLESWPRGVLLTMHDGERTVARLLLSFLMLEILDRAGRGFRPLSLTEKSYMVRLDGFYRRAAEHPWSTPPRYVLYRSGEILRVTVDADMLAKGSD